MRFFFDLGLEGLRLSGAGVTVGLMWLWRQSRPYEVCTVRIFPVLSNVVALYYSLEDSLV